MSTVYWRVLAGDGLLGLRWTEDEKHSAFGLAQIKSEMTGKPCVVVEQTVSVENTLSRLVSVYEHGIDADVYGQPAWMVERMEQSLSGAVKLEKEREESVRSRVSEGGK